MCHLAGHCWRLTPLGNSGSISYVCLCSYTVWLLLLECTSSLVLLLCLMWEQSKILWPQKALLQRGTNASNWRPVLLALKLQGQRHADKPHISALSILKGFWATKNPKLLRWEGYKLLPKSLACTRVTLGHYYSEMHRLPPHRAPRQIHYIRNPCVWSLGNDTFGEFSRSF